MELVKVCRICLVMDVNLYDLRTQPLETYFEIIIGNLLNATELPTFACFECAALVKKYYYFREKCLKGQATLHGIWQSSGNITKDEIQKINRPSKLSVHKTSQTSIIHHIYDEDSVLLIKEEPSIDDNKQSIKIEECMKKEASLREVSLCPSTSEYEIEDTIKEAVFEDLAGLSTDIDEILQTSNKKKKVKEKKKRRGVKKNSTVDPLQDTETASYITEIPIELTEIVPSKPKRCQPRKSYVKKDRRSSKTGGSGAGDLEEYVTVVKLSMEDQIKAINKRQESSNYLRASFKCSLCYKGFIDTKAWTHHLSKHDSSAGDIECPICKFRFKSRYLLHKHSVSHETKYICKTCSYVSTSKFQARRHENWHKGVTYECQYCGDVSTKWTSYLSHVRIKHPSEFICDACGCSFLSKLGLTMHKSRMHKDVADKNEAGDVREPDLYCKECDVKFISVEAFKKHLVISDKHTHITNNNGCRVCGETFKNPEELRIHRRVHARKLPKNYRNRPTDTSWPIKCEQPLKTYRSRRTLFTEESGRLLVATEDSDRWSIIGSRLCSEEISNAWDYWTHFRRVHPDKNYPVQKNHVCDICGKGFKSNTFLVYHKRTHSEERAYKCPTCGKAFHNNGNLQLHRKTHSDARPYPCTVCFKAFKCKGALSKHLRCHTGEKPYVCPVCGKAFNDSSNQKLHIRSVHLKQPVTRRTRLQRKNNS